MATKRQILANPQNASKSTGPKMPEGKAHFSNNALKFGLRMLALAQAEDESAYQTFAEKYHCYLREVGPAPAKLGAGGDSGYPERNDQEVDHIHNSRAQFGSRR